MINRAALANAIAAIKVPSMQEWGVDEASAAAWKDFVRRFQNGTILVVESKTHVAVPREIAGEIFLESNRALEAINYGGGYYATPYGPLACCLRNTLPELRKVMILCEDK